MSCGFASLQLRLQTVSTGGPNASDFERSHQGRWEDSKRGTPRKTIRAVASFRLSSAFLNRIDGTSGPVKEMALDVAHGEGWSCATFLALKR